MVYVKENEGSGGYVVCVLADGQVLRELADGSVVIPFGCEYTVRLRNKTNNRVVAKVFIDDELVTPQAIVVNGRQYVDLECNPETKKKFKFVHIDSSEAINEGKNQHDNPAMGVLRVEWYKERTYVRPNWDTLIISNPNPPTVPHPWVPRTPKRTEPYWLETSMYGPAGLMATSYNPPAQNSAQPLEKGVTVEGGHSSQQFHSVYMDVDWNNPTVCRLVLKGISREVYSQKKSVMYCYQCGTKKVTEQANFCVTCGNKF